MILALPWTQNLSVDIHIRISYPADIELSPIMKAYGSAILQGLQRCKCQGSRTVLCHSANYSSVITLLSYRFSQFYCLVQVLTISVHLQIDPALN